MRYALIVILALATLAAEPTPAYVDSVVRKAMASTGVPAVSLAIVRAWNDRLRTGVWVPRCRAKAAGDRVDDVSDRIGQ